MDNKTETPHVPVPRTYETVSKYLLFPNIDEKEWWVATGPRFSKMLADAKYDIHHQFGYLQLYASHILPFLGPFPKSRPDLYLCVLGGLGSLEFSQNFTKAGATVRMTFEPTSYTASTGEDVCNRGTSDEFLRRLKRVSPKIDLGLYHELLNKLTVTDTEERLLVERDMLAGQEVRTQTMVALDMKNGGIGAKIYFVPILKGIITGTPTWTMMQNAVRSVDRDGLFTEGLANTIAYLDNAPDTVYQDMFSFDLVEPTETRFKIYLSEFQIDFDRITDIWTLGGKIQGEETDHGLALLKELWDSLEIPVGTRPPPTKPVPVLPPDRLPIVVNLEITPNSSWPQPKIYFALPGLNGLAVATAVEKAFRKWGWEDHASSFIGNLRSYKPGVNLAENTNLFSWLSFSYTSKTGPYVTLYHH
ncbi:putative dimethylallyl tryptophan synthase [Aspergillus germanicus]